MGIIKYIRTYLFWTILSLLLGIVYMRLLLGDLPADESIGGVGYVLKVFYVHGLALIGLPIGGTMALLFIIIDNIYLRKKLINNSKKTIIRFGILLAIAVIVVLVHHLLEKVIDVI